jgi:hypothetical protein
MAPELVYKSPSVDVGAVMTYLHTYVGFTFNSTAT